MKSDTSNIDPIMEKIMRQLRSQMPKIIEQVEVYEAAVEAGTVIKNPKPSPQFNV